MPPLLALLPLLAAGGSIGATAASGGFDSKGGGLNVQKIPQIGPIRAIQQLLPRLLVENLENAPSSFTEFLNRGGTRNFDLTPNLTPQQARLLKSFGPQGEPIPFVTPSGVDTLGPGLEEDQLLFLGRLDQQRGRDTRPARTLRTKQKIDKLDKRLERRAGVSPSELAGKKPRKQRKFARKTAKLQARQAALEENLQRLFDKSQLTAGQSLNEERRV